MFRYTVERKSQNHGEQSQKLRDVGSFHCNFGFAVVFHRVPKHALLGIQVSEKSHIRRRKCWMIQVSEMIHTCNALRFWMKDVVTSV